MSLSTYFLEYGRHVARLRRRRRAYAPTSNTASHDNHEKILHGFPFLSHDDYGAPRGGPWGRRSSAIKSSQYSICGIRGWRVECQAKCGIRVANIFYSVKTSGGNGGIFCVTDIRRIPKVTASNFAGKRGRYFSSSRYIFGQVKNVCNSKWSQTKRARFMKFKSHSIYGEQTVNKTCRPKAVRYAYTITKTVQYI